ncbi:MAG TPA: hypothetical protein VMS65_13460 [Polyangiaceae bacterium]|nr:hypothetical protein [Polyangiaceae bacterium]
MVPLADEDPTVRVWLEKAAVTGLAAQVTLPASAPTSDEVASSSAPVHRPVPPPLPSASTLGGHTPPMALEIPKGEVPTWRRLLGERYVRIGVGIFAAGALVGVVGTATVMKHGAAPVVEATGLAALAVEAPKPAALAAPKLPALEPARKPDAPAKAKAESVASGEAQKPALESLPVSGSTAPSCRELLGKSLAERHDPKRALRETRLGNRALVRGNLAEAQAAFCKALFWDRTNIERHINLGRLFLVRRDWAKAAVHGQSALALDPESRPALGLVGDAWAALDKTKEAREAWLLAEKKPNASASELRLIVRRNMALAKRVERLQDFSLAERFYRRVLLIEPEHAGAMKGVASCLLRFGDERAAKIWARRADARRG